MKAIVAVDKNFGIGANDGLLYNIPEDKKFFKEQTSGKIVVMGRKTFLSLPNGVALRDRINVVLTRNPDFQAEGAVTVNGLDELFNYVKRYKSDDVYVIGGGEVYAELLPYCDTVVLTKIEDMTPAEVFFPNIDESSEWVLKEQSNKLKHKLFFFRFCKYGRVNAPKENGVLEDNAL